MQIPTDLSDIFEMDKNRSKNIKNKNLFVFSLCFGFSIKFGHAFIDILIGFKLIIGPFQQKWVKLN